MKRRTATTLLLALVAGVLPLILAAGPASAAPGSATGRLDFDREGSTLDDYDLSYTVQVSNTTPAAGDDVTVTLSWDEVTGVGPFSYSNVNLCWDAPAGWAGAGPAPTVPDYEITTPAGTAANGQVVGTDVPGTPGATADFTSTAATGERADVTSYETANGRVYRFCAHADSIDSVSGPVDNADDIAGSMVVTLEAPAGPAANFNGLLPTSAYVTGGADVPPDPYVGLSPMQSRGSSPSGLGTATNASYDYADSDGATSTPIVVTPSGSLLTYSLETQATNGTAVVNADGSYTYTPNAAFEGDDSFQVEVSDGDGTAVSTVSVEVINTSTPRLGIRKSTVQTMVEVGDAITYEIEVSNLGGVPLTAVAVTDPNAPDCARTVGALAVGARSVYECTLTATQAMIGSRSNVATADSAETDPVDSESVAVTVFAGDSTVNLPYTCRPPAFDPIATTIPVTGADRDDPAQVGQPNVWTLRNSNPGIDVGVEVDLDYIQVEYTIPANLTDVQLDLVNPPGQTANPAVTNATKTVTATVVRFRTPNTGKIHVAANGALTYNNQPVVLPMMQVTATPTAAARNTTIQWKAPRVTVDVENPDLVVPCTPNNPNATVVTTRVAAVNPILDVDKSVGQQVALPGQTLTYEILVRNRGNVDLTNVTIDDAVAPDCDTDVGTLAVGASQTVTCARLVQDSDLGYLRNVAIGDSDQTTPFPSNEAVTFVTDQAISGLTVGLAAASPTVDPGDPAEWIITIQNTGNQDLTGVVLDAADDSDCEEQTVPSTVAVGTTATIECTTPLAEPQPFERGATATNQVTVTADDVDPVTSEEVTVTSPLPPTAWTDVAPWYAPAADWLDYWNLADGYANDQFRGSRSITRGAFLRMVWRLAGEPAGPNPPTHSFTDVPAWVADAVAWAAEDPEGDEPPLMTGLTATRFGPLEPITRGQAVRLIFRWANRVEAQTVPNPPTHSFTDVPAWVADAVAWAADDPDGDGPLEPLITGRTATRFAAGEDITRAQVARLLYRLAGLLDL